MSLAVWGLTDGSAGMKAQVAALAAALDAELTFRTCRLKKPLGELPNWLSAAVATMLPGFLWRLVSTGDALDGRAPDIVISCGRRSVPFALHLRRRARSPFYVHIQQPYVDPRFFDLLVVMAHDKLAKNPSPAVREKLAVTRFALHDVSEGKLQAARQAWRERLETYPAPRVGVLLGGSTNRYTLTEAAMTQAITQLRALREQGGSLLATTSRRTGEANVARLRKAFAGDARVMLYSGEGENPYPGLLALSDVLVVSNDSVNMMTEAAATGKPLYLLQLAGHEGTKPARFAKMLEDSGIARTLPAKDLSARWEYAIPDEAAVVAAEIRRRLKNR